MHCTRAVEVADVAVIGGGVLGAMVARALMRYDVRVVVLEKEVDICQGITRANSATIYAGYDNKPGSLKARLTVAGNEAFTDLCEALDVPFARKGSLMVAKGPEGAARLEKKYAQGLANGVKDLRLLRGDEVKDLAPQLEKVHTALYAPSTGVVDPWRLTYHAMENAKANGCTVLADSKVQAIQKVKDGYTLATTKGEVGARAVVNCAGLAAAAVHKLCFEGEIELEVDASDYLVFDACKEAPKQVLFFEEEDGKGVTLVPLPNGRVLASGGARPLEEEGTATSRAGLERLREKVAAAYPSLDHAPLLKTFAALRPNPKSGAESFHDFVIERPAPTFVSLVGVKTPGLTCAPLLGEMVANDVAAALRAKENPQFCGRYHAMHEAGGEVVCLCGSITEGEVRTAVNAGARSAKGVSRRTGACLGPCQGERCRSHIEKMLGENDD